MDGSGCQAWALTGSTRAESALRGTFGGQPPKARIQGEAGRGVPIGRGGGGLLSASGCRQEDGK